MAVVISFPDMGWNGCCARARPGQDPDFAKLFFGVRNQVLDRKQIKSWTEQEVESVKISGVRVEKASFLLDKTMFKTFFNEDCDQVCPQMVISVTDEHGNKLEGIPLADETPDGKFRKLIHFSEEFFLSKDGF